MPQRVTSSTRELKTAQRRALLALESEPGASLTRSEYEGLTGAGRSQAAYDLSELVSAGLLIRLGGGRATRYVLAHEHAARRRWTPDRIRRELDMFCAGRSTWPTATEFKTARHGDLYVAASRYGGVAHWAEELGLERGERSQLLRTVAHAPLRIRIAWAVAGALAALVLAGAAATAVFTTHDFGSSPGTGSRESDGLLASRAVGQWLQPLRITAPARNRARQHLTRPTARAAPRVRQKAAEETTPVASSPYTASAPTATSAFAAAAARSGPAPLPAPVGASAPTALRSP